jgi:hypothetical protein
MAHARLIQVASQIHHPFASESSVSTAHPNATRANWRQLRRTSATGRVRQRPRDIGDKEPTSRPSSGPRIGRAQDRLVKSAENESVQPGGGGIDVHRRSWCFSHRRRWLRPLTRGFGTSGLHLLVSPDPQHPSSRGSKGRQGAGGSRLATHYAEKSSCMSPLVQRDAMPRAVRD